MTMPSLPVQGSTNWYAWAQSAHAAAEAVTTGRLTDNALRAASVAAVEDATAVAPAGAWDFAQAPTVNGSPFGTGGSDLYANIRDFGAVLDGTTNDRAAIVAAITSLGSRGGTLFVPRGIAQVGSSITVPSNVRFVGAGKNASILRKAFNGTLLNFSGTGTAVRCQRGGAADLMLSGGGNTTGALVRAEYADHLNFDRVWFADNNDSAFIGVELWDSYFESCEFEWTSGADGTKPAVLLKSTATDSTNEIYFSHCRWESFRDGALWMASGGVTGPNTLATGPNPVYGVYLSDCKMETHFARGSFVDYSADVADVHVDKIYLAAAALDAGLTSANAPNLVNFVPASFCSWSRVHAFINGNAARTVFRVFAGSPQASIKDVQVNAATALGTAILEWAGGNPAMHVGGIRYKAGTGGAIPVYAGTQPSNVINDDAPVYTDEQVRDVIGAALVAGANVSITPNDGGDTITIAASGGGGGGVLASASYDPAAYTLKTIGTDVPTVLDATNLSVTFTAPASGAVLVNLTALAGSAGVVDGYWCLIDTAGTVVSRSCLAFWASASTSDTRMLAAFKVTGLTSGTSYTWRWGHYNARNNAVNLRTIYGPTNNPAVMQVFAA